MPAQHCIKATPVTQLEPPPIGQSTPHFAALVPLPNLNAPSAQSTPRVPAAQLLFPPHPRFSSPLLSNVPHPASSFGSPSPVQGF
ncbi:hypothetical protein BD310DRAFT_97764 [Dichomitus squalens]|uniref:Uncharacterized protein n=1 Tax=Dichomitus squalens TaxID=114155 RepID=A0A4V2K707_9APHY|nr:hypothetical protein BD310DRAFT_97764 [Dichomitus squalens]